LGDECVSQGAGGFLDASETLGAKPLLVSGLANVGVVLPTAEYSIDELGELTRDGEDCDGTALMVGRALTADEAKNWLANV
jgi:hypothetical protein